MKTDERGGGRVEGKKEEEKEEEKRKKGKRTSPESPMDAASVKVHPKSLK